MFVWYCDFYIVDDIKKRPEYKLFDTICSQLRHMGVYETSSFDWTDLNNACMKFTYVETETFSVEDIEREIKELIYNTSRKSDYLIHFILVK